MQKKQKLELVVLAVVVLLLAAANWESIAYFNNPPKKISAQHDGKVVLYATEWCQYCARVRDIFEYYNVDYVEYDIEKSSRAREQHKAIGGKGVPVILYDGDVVVGFNPDRTTAIAKLALSKP